MNRKLTPLFASALLAVSSPALADSSSQPVPQIRVTGEGTVSVKPDMALLDLTVMREAKTARQALDENNAAMAAVLDAMKKAGIEERDLQTSNFSINPRYVYPKNNDGNNPPKIVAYQVSNSLTVRIRDLAAVGTILDKSVTLGVNQGGNVIFTNDDPSQVLTEARKKAVKDALERAATLTEAAGIGLGQILEISEQSFQPGPMPMGKARTMAMEAADAVPIAGGENDYRVTVNVSLELKQ